MSLNFKMELYKVKREIKRSGTEHTFYRDALNDFGEPTGELEEVLTVKGLYHEYNPHTLDTYVYITNEEIGVGRNKKTPQVLCLFDDVFFSDNEGEEKYMHVNIGDVCYFGKDKYICTGIRNYQELNIAVDISFEGVGEVESRHKIQG